MADIFPVVPSAPSVSNISQGEPAIDPNTTSSTSESGIQTNLVVDVPLFPVAEVTELTIAPSAIPAQQLYPGEVMKARYWSNPLEYEPASYVETALIQGFKPIDPLAVTAPGTLPAPSRIIIPSINVDSDVAGLAIRDLGDSRAYETPKHVVGHIPTTANPVRGAAPGCSDTWKARLPGRGMYSTTCPRSRTSSGKGRMYLL